MTINAMNNNALASLIQRAAPPVLNAIKAASQKTGVDFAYLMEQAAAESNFKPAAKAGTSSATGLYQFIESTWLHMVKKHGDKYGLGDYAAQIDGRGRVNDPALRAEILDLRKDPEKASFMAAELARENRAHLERHVGGDIGATEMYFAHFMGASGAAGFLNAMKQDPLSVAADLFPKEARANHNVFYDSKTGQARTLAGVYEFFDRKFGAGDSAPSQPSSIADSAQNVAQNIVMPAKKPAPVPATDHTQHALRVLAGSAADETQNQPVYKNITHPYLQHIKQDSTYSWQRTAGLPAASYVRDPVSLMMMARLEAPGAARR